MDLSSFSFFNFGEILQYYSVTSSPVISEINPMPGCMFCTALSQSNVLQNEQWVVKSFD